MRRVAAALTFYALGARDFDTFIRCYEVARRFSAREPSFCHDVKADAHFFFFFFPSAFTARRGACCLFTTRYAARMREKREKISSRDGHRSSISQHKAMRVIFFHDCLRCCLCCPLPDYFP